MTSNFLRALQAFQIDSLDYRPDPDKPSVGEQLSDERYSCALKIRTFIRSLVETPQEEELIDLLLEGNSMTECAEALNVKRDTVHKRFSKFKERVQSYYTKCKDVV